MRLVFGAGGNARPLQREGWGDGEDGFTWSLGHSCALSLPVPEGAGDALLEVSLRPYIGPYVRRQRLLVSANGIALGSMLARGEMAMQFDLTRAVLDEAPRLRLRFDQPDAVAPAEAGEAGGDTRVLGFAFREIRILPAPAEAPMPAAALPPLPGDTREALREAAEAATGKPLAELCLDFESLGRNCEFGLVQRHFGAEPLGLLRFASIAPGRLLEGLRCGFDGLAEAGNMALFVLPDDPSRELLVRDARYGTESHSFIAADAADPDRVLREAERRYAFLRRSFCETMAQGSKIFVFQHPFVHGPEVARPLLHALQAHGPCWLLWVSADASRPPGSVELVRPYLLHGAIDQLAPESRAMDGNLLAWTSLLANAWRIARARGFRPAGAAA